MRAAFSECLVAAAKRDPRMMLLTGDHGYALFDNLRRECPRHYFNAGIAEQNMVGVAAGMAKAGLRPICYGLSAFVPIRVLEQIKLDVCYENLPVIFIGDGAGVVYSSLGTSHQSTEDIAALRAMPNMTILSPADAHELTACMELAFSLESPVYLRMGKADLGVVHAERPRIKLGQLLEAPRDERSGKEVRASKRVTSERPLTLIATGSMVTTAMRVAESWPTSVVWSAPCIKPLDAEQVTALCRASESVVVLEEHSVYGGLGSAVAEIAAESAAGRVLRVGIQDRFSAYCGSYEYLMREHELTAEHISQKIAAHLAATSNRELPAKRLSPPPSRNRSAA